MFMVGCCNLKLKPEIKMLFPGISPALMCLGALCVLATKTGCCEIAFAFIDHGGLPTYPKPNRLQTPLIMMAVIIL